METEVRSATGVRVDFFGMAHATCTRKEWSSREDYGKQGNFCYVVLACMKSIKLNTLHTCELESRSRGGRMPIIDSMINDCLEQWHCPTILYGLLSYMLDGCFSLFHCFNILVYSGGRRQRRCYGRSLLLLSDCAVKLEFATARN
jgi:hypothetical protein